MVESNNYDGIDDLEIKVFMERKPSREARDGSYGRIKAVMRHEFKDIESKGHPNFKAEVTLQGSLEPLLFAKLDGYGDGITFGLEALGSFGVE